MKTTLLIALTALPILPSAASAATVTADIERQGGVEVGPVTFKAARGEANDVTVSLVDDGLRFRDAANPVKARGDCEQVDSRTAVCPDSEDMEEVRLGNRGDTLLIADPRGNIAVFGGAGSDVLRGLARLRHPGRPGRQ